MFFSTKKAAPVGLFLGTVAFLVLTIRKKTIVLLEVTKQQAHPLHVPPRCPSMFAIFWRIVEPFVPPATVTRLLLVQGFGREQEVKNATGLLTGVPLTIPILSYDRETIS